jgi:hypothetical protein
MKPVARGLCLALLLPLSSANASIESGGRQRGAPPLPAESGDVASVEKAISADEVAAPPRRTRLADRTPADRPVFTVTAVFHAAPKHDPSRKDNCLKFTGTRLKRDAAGKGACVIGNGQVFKPAD